MLDSVNAVPADSGEDEVSERIDALLSSALADQARERRMLVETVFGAKTALVKAEEELAALRELIDKRDEALLAAVSKNNDEIVEAVSAKIKPSRDAALTLRIEAIEEAILQLAERVADYPEQARDDLSASVGVLDERLSEQSASLLADLREDQVEVVQALARMSEGEVRDLKQAMAATAQDVIEAANSIAEQLVAHLTGYLLQRDDQLYKVRDQRLVELFGKLGEALGARDRRKLVKVLGDQVATARPPEPPGNPRAPVNPAPHTFQRPSGGGAPHRNTDPTESAPPRGFASSPPPGQRPAGFNDPRPPDTSRVPDPADFFDNRAPSGPTQAIANPLSRAELARDYLLEPPSDVLAGQDPPPGWESRKSGGAVSPPTPGKGPAKPRGRRKT